MKKIFSLSILILMISFLWIGTMETYAARNSKASKAVPWQTQCDRKYPGTVYRKAWDMCICTTWSYNNALKKCTVNKSVYESLDEIVKQKKQSSNTDIKSQFEGSYQISGCRRKWYCDNSFESYALKNPGSTDAMLKCYGAFDSAIKASRVSYRMDDYQCSESEDGTIFTYDDGTNIIKYECYLNSSGSMRLWRSILMSTYEMNFCKKAYISENE